MTNRATSAQVARSAGVGRLLDHLGAWRSAPGPRFQRLARGVAAAVERGELPRGTRLPSERALAAAAGLSRGTVVAAYDVLVGEGVAERRAGSGTFVVGGAGVDLPPGREGSHLVAHLAERGTGAADVVDLSIAVLDDPSGLPAVAVSTGDLGAEVAATGYDPRGQPGLRAALAARLSDEGLPTTAAQVLVTTGAQQAISLAAACWVRPGDVVLVEDPTYPGALSAFTAAGAVVRGLPMDGHGLRVDALEAALADRPALVYLQSALHNPTGVVLAPARRARVAALVSAHRVPLVEDLALAGLTWATGAPPIAASAPDHPIAVVGSLSKRFWSGLRVGFARAPLPVAQRLARIKTTHDLGSPIAAQVLAARLLAHPDADASTTRRNAELRRRHEAATEQLRAAIPAWTVHPAAGGLSLWVRLPGPVADRFADVALDHGVAVARTASLSPADGAADHLRLSVGVPAATWRIGVDRLAAAWAACSR